DIYLEWSARLELCSLRIASTNHQISLPLLKDLPNKVQQQGNVRSNTYSRDNGDHNVNQKPMKQEKGFPRSQYDKKNRPKFTCYSCGEEGHVKKFCPKLVKTNSDQDSRRKANVLRIFVD
ncbi:hypothetical protein AVEN_249866-1, partial [Araneus ventricosus]